MIISKGKLYKIFSIIIISLFAVIYIFPLIVMVTTSFKTYNEAFDPSIGIFPKSL